MVPDLVEAGGLWQDARRAGFQKGDPRMGKKDALRGRARADGRSPQPAVPPDVVSAARGEAVTSARRDTPQDWALLDRVLDGSPIGIVVLDRALRFLRVNTQAASMFGVDEHKHAGRRVASVLPEMFAEIGGLLVGIIGGGAPHVAVETAAPKIGDATPSRLYLAYYYPLVADGSVIGVGCMFIDITEQRAAEGALLESEAERCTVLGHLLHAEERARSRLASELHEETIEVLCALLLQFDGIIQLAQRAGQNEILARLENSHEVLSAATARARNLVFRLHPNVLEERGLRAAITACAQEIGGEIRAEWSVDVPVDRYAWTLEYRVVREALSNIRKHSHADHFSVTIAKKAHRLCGVVQDDGQGLTKRRDRPRPSPPRSRRNERTRTPSRR